MAKTFIQRARDVAPSEKAAFHQITGAGKSRVKREFFGLSARDEELILNRFAFGLERLLRESDVR